MKTKVLRAVDSFYEPTESGTHPKARRARQQEDHGGLALPPAQPEQMRQGEEPRAVLAHEGKSRRLKIRIKPRKARRRREERKRERGKLLLVITQSAEALRGF